MQEEQERLHFERVASVGDVAPGKMRCVEVRGRDVLICHLDEGFFAVENLCSHADAKMSEGRLRGHKVLCPLHGAAFDVRDGSVLRPPAMRPIRSYPVRVEDEGVWVGFEDE